MNSLQKTAVSLLISIVLFAIVAILAYTGGFELVEMRFYEPRKAGSVYSQLSRAGGAFNGYYDETSEIFSEFLAQPSVNSYLKRSPEKQSVEVRHSLENYLFMRITALEGMRLIESDGEHIHFSTYPQDILEETKETVSYRNYSTLNEIPFSKIEAPDTGVIATTVEYINNCGQLYLDAAGNRFVFSYPMFDEYTAYRGTFVFYVNVEGFMRMLSNRSIVALNTHAVVVGDLGIVFDIPMMERSLLTEQIEKCWGQKRFGIEQITVYPHSARHGVEVSEADALSQFLLTVKNQRFGLCIGTLRSASYFKISSVEKFLVLLTLFISSFLVVFLLLNIKQDDMVVVRSKIQHFEYIILKEYIERRDNETWEQLAQEITRRRMDVNEEFKRSLGKRAKRHPAEVDELIDQCWREVAAAMGGNVIVMQGQPSYVQGAPLNAASSASTMTASAYAAMAQNVQTHVVPAVPVELSIAPVSVPEPLDVIEEVRPVNEAAALEPEELVEELEPEELTEDVTEAEAAPLDAKDDVEELSELDELEVEDKGNAIPSPAKEEDDEDIAELEPVGAYIEELVPVQEDLIHSETEAARSELENTRRKKQEREEEFKNLSSADAIASFINRISEDDDNVEGQQIVEECSIEDYMVENSLLKRPSENAEELRKQVEDSFVVRRLDFSSLDNM